MQVLPVARKSVMADLDLVLKTRDSLLCPRRRQRRNLASSIATQIFATLQPQFSEFQQELPNGHYPNT